MINLAGRKDCDDYILEELIKARIDLRDVSGTTGEVPYTVEGTLGNFKFRRAWYYWVVEGDVPLNVAREIYDDPCGAKDIRADGDCARRHPDTWANQPRERVAEIRKMCNFGEIPENPSENREAWDSWIVAGNKVGEILKAEPLTDDCYIDTYHIDSEIGLRVFADILRKHGLHEVK